MCDWILMMGLRRVGSWLVLAGGLTVAPLVLADARSDFLAAEQALKRGDRETVARLAEGLRDYPLYPYLRFAELTQGATQTPDPAIEAFLLTYADSQLATRLRRVYLDRLAKAGRWSDYARLYRLDESSARRCLYLRALLETGRGEEALGQVEPLWLSPDSQPAVCDPVFAAWREAGRLTTERLWQRIRLAMEAGQAGLARHLGKDLPADEQVWLTRWLAVERTPAQVLDAGEFAQAHALRAAILAHGIARLARGAPERAAQALARWQDRLADDQAASDRAHAAVGRALTRAGDSHGLEVWDALPARPDNLAEQEARLRAAIAWRDWERVAEWVARMPESDEKADRWLYWQARAESALGQEEQAHATFEQAARRRSFWGFMAADRIDRPYNLEHVATPAEPERIRALVASPAFRRIRELDRLGRETDRRREWRALTQEMATPDLMAAAYVADLLRWHDQAVLTLARTRYWDDLALRFPLEHAGLVEEQSWQIGIEPDWILAVIRQESVFAPAVMSSAGAVGLMQLLPGTAREVAAEFGWTAPSRSSLSEPALNIALGSAYLAQMRDRFGHPALATAAYNAGPQRVARWLPDDCLEADLWIAGIPFAETRGYVERVLAYRIIYAERLGLEPRRLSELLPPVPSASARHDARIASRSGDRNLQKTNQSSEPRQWMR